VSDSTEMSRRRHESKSEDQFLSTQVEKARLALRQTVTDIKDDALAAADPRCWVPKYPLRSMVVGFGAGFAMTHTSGRDDASDGDAPDGGEKKTGTLGKLLRAGRTVARFMLTPI